MWGNGAGNENLGKGTESTGGTPGENCRSTGGVREYRGRLWGAEEGYEGVGRLQDTVKGDTRALQGGTGGKRGPGVLPEALPVPGQLVPADVPHEAVAHIEPPAGPAAPPRTRLHPPGRAGGGNRSPPVPGRGPFKSSAGDRHAALRRRGARSEQCAGAKQARRTAQAQNPKNAGSCREQCAGAERALGITHAWRRRGTVRTRGEE